MILEATPPTVNTYARSGVVDPATAASLLGHSPRIMWKYDREVSEEDRRKAATVVRLGVLPGGEVLALTERRQTG